MIKYIANKTQIEFLNKNGISTNFNGGFFYELSSESDDVYISVENFFISDKYDDELFVIKPTNAKEPKPIFVNCKFAVLINNISTGGLDVIIFKATEKQKEIIKNSLGMDLMPLKDYYLMMQQKILIEGSSIKEEKVDLPSKEKIEEILKRCNID